MWGLVLFLVALFGTFLYGLKNPGKSIWRKGPRRKAKRPKPFYSDYAKRLRGKSGGLFKRKKRRRR